jgi:hypothetical protein
MQRRAQAALWLTIVLGAPALVGAQDTTASSVMAAARTASGLRVSFRPPERGTVRERVPAYAGDPTRALIPDIRVDTLIPQTMRSTPHVAVCVGSPPDSARLTVRLRDSSASAMIALSAGLNRIALAETGLLLQDGDVASWSLASRSGATYLESQIERRVVRATPTVASLTRNGIWFDALDLFVVDAMEGRPLAAERLSEYLGGAGIDACRVGAPR